MDRRGLRIARAVLAAIAWLGSSWTALLVITSGFDARIAGRTITAHDSRRPLLASALALSLVLLIGGDDVVVRRVRVFVRVAGEAWQRISTLALRWHVDVVTAIGLSVLVVALAGPNGAKAVGGSDAYGYVSEADLWLTGHVTVSQPWVNDVPWPNAVDIASPLGFRRGPDRWLIEPPIPHAERDPQSISPFYPAGLPLLMAGAKLIAGHAAMFWIPPIAGGVLVLGTFGVGRRLGSSVAGLIAAWLVATSPNVIQMEQSMMSDVPVAAAWVVTFWSLLGSSRRSGAIAGLAAAIAILIRPNLVFVSGVVLLLVAWQIATARGVDRRRQIIRAALAIGGVGAGSVAVAVINWAMYGSPFVGGLGRLQDVLHWSNVPTNFLTYTDWFVKVHTAFGLAGIAALFLPIRPLWRGVPRVVVLCLGLFVAGVWLNYLLYGFFETEYYLRFVLSSWPFIMLGLARVMLVPAELATPRLKGALTVAAMLVALWWGWQYVPAHPSLTSPRVGESKYVTAAYHARGLTPENSAFFAMQHSGAARYYAGRVTLRWDFFQVEWIDRGVAWLSEHGAHPYLFAEDWERDLFAERFKGSSVVRALSRPPILRFREVLVYDLAPDPNVVTPTLEIPESDAILACLPPAPAPTLVFRNR